jgi:methionine sulfoxide reductase heme-binding subunit
VNIPFWWYLSRGAGISSWTCGAVSVAVGLALVSKATLKPRPSWQLAVHRHLAMLTLTSLAIHIVAIVLDGYTSFGAADVLIPFHSSWKPVAVATGVFSMWILVTVEGTSLLKRRMPNRIWQMIHRTSILAYLLATAHFLQAGTDRRNVFAFGVVVLVTLVNLVLLVFRALAQSRPRPQRVARV